MPLTAHPQTSAIRGKEQTSTMNEYTTDLRELDNLYLATIGGVDFYETRQIVKQDNGVRSVVGRASDWPLIQRDAQIRELTALLTAIERGRAEMDISYVEQACRLSAYKDELDDAVAATLIYKAHIAALEAALAETQPPALPPSDVAQAEAAFVASIALLEAPKDSRVACDHPGCETRVWPRGVKLHKKRMHGTTLTEPATPDPQVLPAPIALELGEPPWRCAQCSSATHARSLKEPSLCIKCVVAAIEPHTNGHQVAA
jgi:hypothetical protein